MSLRQRAEEVFHSVLELPHNQQHKAIRARCGQDRALLAEVEALLSASDADVDRFVDDLIDQRDQHLDESDSEMREWMPEHIGPYRIRRVIGQGGMGLAFEAEQEKPKRTVVVKIIRPGMLSDIAVRRFSREAQALGQLRHPSIAQIHEAGVARTQHGPVPYIAMEYVEGQPLSTLGDGQSVDEKLELLARICDAMQYAHQKGIIHRDLKPANIFVTTEYVSASAKNESTGELRVWPKILDFGIARMEEDSPDLTVQTQTGQLIGTLPYMSPEQVSGNNAEIDTRSDVYAIGVILYEVLAGSHPVRVEGLSVPEAARRICDHVIHKLGKVNPSCRGDIETIVHKAIERDPARRYQSAGALGEDIRRYLRDEPISARPDSLLYQVGKLGKRHRGTFVGVMIAMLAIGAGAVAAGWWAIQADQSERLALKREAEARWMAYRSGMVVAQQLVDSHPERARRELDQLPPELRQWEWYYLSHRVGAGLTKLAKRYASGWDGQGRPIGARVEGSTIEVSELHSLSVVKTIELGEPCEQLLMSQNARLLFGILPQRSVVASWDIESSTRRFEVPIRPKQASQTQAASDSDRRFTLRISPRGTCIVVLHSKSGPIDFLDGTTGESLRSIELPGEMSSSSWSPDDSEYAIWVAGQFARVAVRDESPVCWKPTTQQYAPLELPKVNRIAEHIGADHRTYYQLRDSLTGQIVADLSDPFWTIGRGASIDQKWIATANPNRVTIWNTKDGQREASVFCGPHSWPLFDPMGEQLLLARPGGGTTIWRWRARAPYREITDYESTVYLLDVSPDGKWLAAGGWDQTVKVWNLKSLDLAHTFSAPGRTIGGLRFTADSARLVGLVSGGWDLESFYIWDCVTGEVLKHDRLLEGEDEDRDDEWTEAYYAMAAPGAKMVWGASENAAISHDGHLRAAGFHIWEEGKSHVAVSNAQGEQVRELPGRCVAFSPDDRMLATGDDEGIVRIYDTRSWKLLAELSEHERKVYALTFSPDGLRLASGSIDSTIRIWDMKNFQAVLTLPGTRTSCTRSDLRLTARD
jgi:serine/threonine protein kinase/WD40 repeat protein